jgi:hypothetical protein
MKIAILLLGIFFSFTSLNCIAQQASGIPAINISIKNNNIYNNNEMIGTYRTLFIDSELTSIVVYNKAKARVAEATYAKRDENWTILTPVDQNKMYFPWNKEHTIELLFIFLVEKKYL